MEQLKESRKVLKLEDRVNYTKEPRRFVEGKFFEIGVHDNSEKV